MRLSRYGSDASFTTDARRRLQRRVSQPSLPLLKPDALSEGADIIALRSTLNYSKSTLLRWLIYFANVQEVMRCP